MILGLLDGRPEVLAATALIGAYLFVVGVGVRAVVSPKVTLPRSVGVTVGLGTAVTMVTGSLAYQLAGNVEAVAWPLVLLAAVAAAARLLRSARDTRAEQALTLLAPTWGDVLALLLASAVLAPIIRHGLAVWTTSIHDFPSYAGSAELWADGSAAFLDRHPDGLGALVGWRADFEKPGMTALLAVAARISGHGAFALLTPLTWLLLFVLLASLTAAVSTLFRGSVLVLAAAVAVPTLSIIPMSRVFDAQLGHLATAALIGLALVMATAIPRTAGRLQALPWSLLTGTIVAAALMANVWLFLGSAGLVGPLFLWAAWRAGAQLVPLLRAVVLGAAVTAVLSIPSAGWYATSYRFQVTAETFAVPFPGPGALVGLQRTLHDTPSVGMALAQWGVLVALFLVGCAFVRVSLRRGWRPVLVALLGLANLAVIVVVNGLETYQAHKWLALAITCAVPVLLAGAVSAFPERLRAPVAAAALLCCVPVVAVAASAASDASVRIHADDLEALSSSPTIAERESVNIDLGDMTATSLASFAAPNEQVVALGRTYAGTGVPIGSDLIVRRDSLSDEQRAAAIDVSPSYSLVDLDLTVPPDGVVRFGAGHPENRLRLGGRWLEPEGAGIWTNGGRSNEVNNGESMSVALDLDRSLRGRAVRLTITGFRLAGPDEPRRLVVAIGDRTIGEQTFTEPEPQSLVVTVPADLTDEPGGRLVVTLGTPDPLSPADLGSADERKLGFFLSSVQVSPG